VNLLVLKEFVNQFTMHGMKNMKITSADCNHTLTSIPGMTLMQAVGYTALTKSHAEKQHYTDCTASQSECSDSVPSPDTLKNMARKREEFGHTARSSKTCTYILTTLYTNKIC
jgi:hypothetical protein